MLDAAQHFLAGHARVLERRRFARLFADGPAAPVRHAVLAFRNDDGGFGHALEPDGRGPESQPAALLTALTVLDESDAWDDDVARAACEWLVRHEPAGGGTPFVLPGVEAWPHGPWWQPQDGLPASLTTTGQVLAPLLARGVEHEWIDRATAWMWSAADAAAELAPYDAIGLTAFLDATPDRDRAEAAVDRIAPALRATIDHGIEGAPDQHTPLDFARRPDSVARRVFGEAAVEAALDDLAAGQRDDGGWTFTWLAWSPVAEAEWRGVVTLAALSVLRRHGRL